jgi:hypothetical protein
VVNPEDAEVTCVLESQGYCMRCSCRLEGGCTVYWYRECRIRSSVEQYTYSKNRIPMRNNGDAI